MTMRALRRVVFSAFIVIGLGVQTIGHSMAANPFLAGEQAREALPYFEANPFKSFPGCDAQTVLTKITSKFRYGEDRTWKRGFLISDITRITTLSELVSNRPERHSRRYCRARAHFSNGRVGKLHYLIEEGAGFVGTRYDVAYCIDGLNPWRVSDGFCRTVRPF